MRNPLIIFLCLIGQIAYAGQVQVETSVSSADYLLGDWIPITLSVTHSPRTQILPPQVSDKYGELHFVKMEALAPEMLGDVVIDKWLLTLAGFDTGRFSVPPIEVNYRDAGDTTLQQALSDSFYVFIAGVGGDTLKQPYDIKPPVSIKREFADYLLYIVLAVFAGLVVVGYFYWKKWKAQKSSLSETPVLEIKVAPFDLALRKLTELEAKKLWEKGFVKEYYSENTIILKEYFEGEFGFNALEMTTEEFLDELQNRQFDLSSNPAKFLGLADLVKFAKLIPPAEKCKIAVKDAYSIIREAHFKHQPVEIESEEVR
jgi:hypothetical protein